MPRDIAADPALLAAGGITAESAGPVVTVTLARPEVRNAQTPATWRALAAVGCNLPSDTQVVILKADGVSFSAGLDRRMFSEGIAGEPSLVDLAAMTPTQTQDLIEGYQRGFTWFREVDAISIAIVQGHAVGAGFQLALAADMIVAADDALFCMREPQLGLVPDLAGTWPLVEAVGYSRALEICVTGRWVTAQEAAAFGFVVGVAPLTEVHDSAQRIIDNIVNAPPGAIAETKGLLRHAMTRTRDEQRLAERQAQSRQIAQLASFRNRS